MKPFLFTPLLGATLASAALAQTCFDREVGRDLLLGDDTTAQGLDLGFTFPFAGTNYTQICVASNGYIWLGPTSVLTSDYTPTVAELSTGAARICPLWVDLNPSAAGSGHVYFKTTANEAVISWAAVYEYGTTNALDFQIVLRDSGHIRVTYGANAATGGSLPRDVLVGASVGGGATVEPVVFANHPLLVATDSFAEFYDMPGATPIANLQLDWSPAFPGFGVSHVPCTVDALPPPAKEQMVGRGCPFRTVSIYETYANDNGGLDANGLFLSFTPNGLGGYIVGNNTPRSLPPLGVVTALPAGDDVLHHVLLPFAWPHSSGLITEIWVSSNGFLTLGAPTANSGCCNGDVAALLAGPPRIAGFWQDLAPGVAGMLRTEYDPIAGLFAVSWNAVPEYGSTNSNTFRIVLDRTGEFDIVLSNIALLHPTRHALIGYSDGNGAMDPGMTDLTMFASPLDLGAVRKPLTMMPVAGMVPRIGTTVAIDVFNIAPWPEGNVTALLISTETPPIDLSIYGVDGCTGYVMMPPLRTDIVVSHGHPQVTFLLPVPNAIPLTGIEFMAQAVSDDHLANPLGWRTSNAVRLLVGL